MNMKTLFPVHAATKLCLVPVDDIGHKKVSDDNTFAGTNYF